ncbi:MAG: hypothetical protein G01um10147_135 [Microgenomates group bacterium Gr01-1014_7]|nr:MAG: hypothetical protein G01um10147_135 [Microgenomates group bacterium Gr01-1014_7]
MIETEGSEYTPRVEVVFNPEQGTPFGVQREGNQWQLSVNRTFFESKGFTLDEINGAIYLEEACLSRQTTASSKAVVDGLRRWQDLAAADPKASVFKAGFERLSALASLEEKDLEKAASARRYLEKFSARLPSSDHTDQLFSALLKKQLGQDVTPDNDLVDRVLNNLQKPENIEGRAVSPLEALCSPDLSFSAKVSWFDARFLPRLKFLENQDQKRQESKPAQPNEEQPTPEEPQEPPTPPPAEDEYEQHRGREEKGKGAPLFVIAPGYTGYFETDSFDSIDESSGRLKKSDILRMKTAMSSTSANILDNTRRTISGYSGTNLFGLPLAPRFVSTQEGLETLKNQGFETYSDAEDHVFLKSRTNSPIGVEIALSAGLPNVIRSQDSTTSELNLPDQIGQELTKINNLSTDSLGKIQEWQDFIQGFFKYPPDDQVEGMYTVVDSSTARLRAMTDGKLLDCYLAREFFIAGLKRLNLPDVVWRGVNGHFVASRQKDGTTHISSGTGHSWVKVKVDGQNNWIIFDPTPPGDPIHKGEGAIDEFGELSPEPLSEENLQDLENEAQSGDNKKEPQQTQDQYLLQFAREAGISEDEAKEILRVLSQVDQTTDRQGRILLARLEEQFSRIIQEYTDLRMDTLGLVRMSRGRGLKEPVDTLLDLRSGNLDPGGFERKRLVEEKEQFYGGWDLEIVGDGSRSMKDPLGGRIKYIVQRDMSYLLHRALHQFSQEAQRRKLRLVTPLKIRSSQYMFRGNEVEEIKPLTDEFTPTQMALLWKKSAENIHGGTPAHLGLEAVLDRIPPEDVQLLRDKQLLKVVALISDGDYDDSSRVRALIERAQEMNVIVAEFHITDERSLEDLPQNVAESVIDSAKKLIPEKVK